jgi:hypothetical protein
MKDKPFTAPQFHTMNNIFPRLYHGLLNHASGAKKYFYFTRNIVSLFFVIVVVVVVVVVVVCLMMPNLESCNPYLGCCHSNTHRTGPFFLTSG